MISDFFQHAPALAWFVLGIVLLLLELVTPVFVESFFGLGALVVALLLWLFPSMPFWLQLAVFSAASILSLVFLRRYLRNIFIGTSTTTAHIDDEFTGRTATVVSPIAPPLAGRVRLGDAEWSASADVPVPENTPVRVLSRDNLTLRVEPLSPATRQPETTQQKA